MLKEERNVKRMNGIAGNEILVQVYGWTPQPDMKCCQRWLKPTSYIYNNSIFVITTFSWLETAVHNLPWSNEGFRTLPKDPTAVYILLWLHQGLNHKSSGSQSFTLATRLQAAARSVQDKALLVIASQGTEGARMAVLSGQFLLAQA